MMPQRRSLFIAKSSPRYQMQARNAKFLACFISW